MTEVLIEQIRSWAERKPEISRLWVYGSRVKKTFRENSDLDIAIELSPDFEFADFICEKAGWCRGLQTITPFPLDIKLYEDNEGCVCKNGVEEASILVYTNSPNNSLQPSRPRAGRPAEL